MDEKRHDEVTPIQADCSGQGSEPADIKQKDLQAIAQTEQSIESPLFDTERIESVS